MEEKEIVIKVKKLDERAVIPSYAHDGDVGMDFTAIDVEYDAEKDLYIYHTGLAFESDFNYGQFLFPRSSNRKTDAYLCNSVGIADSPIYRGEILFCYKNRDSIESIATNRAINHAIFAVDDIGKRNYKSFVEKFLEIKEETITHAKNLAFAPYKVGDRIGQMVMLQYPTVKFEVVDELSETVRNNKGFGSTGD